MAALVNDGYFFHFLIYLFICGLAYHLRPSCPGLLSRGSSFLGELEEVPGQRGRFGRGMSILREYNTKRGVR